MPHGTTCSFAGSYRKEKIMKPLIGVTPLYDDKKESIWMIPGYMDLIRLAGGIPVILPLCSGTCDIDQLDQEIDGYLFTGGHDINPALYGVRRSSRCGPSCDARDHLETLLFRKAYQEDKPVFGICRGIQLINVLSGGTLYQDLPGEYPRRQLTHSMKPPYDRAAHPVFLMKNTPLYDLLQCESIPVNSYHHQAIRSLGFGIKPMAVTEDGLVEGIYIPDKTYIQAVQWHPEFSYQKDEKQIEILRTFTEAAGKYRAEKRKS